MKPRLADSAAEAVAQLAKQVEIDARQQSYAVATQIVTQVITRYGNHEAPNVCKYWADISDGVYKKIKEDGEKALLGK